MSISLREITVRVLDIDIVAEIIVDREIEILRPAMLLALGSEAYGYLVSKEVRSRHGLPVEQLWHPSWTNMRGGEARYVEEELPRLRCAYLRALESGAT